MQEQVRQDLVVMLQEALKAVQTGNYTELSDISNHSIHNASIYQDEDSLSAAVLLYALSKLLSRYAADSGSQKFSLDVEKNIREALHFLDHVHDEEFRKLMKDLLAWVAKTDSKLKLYITEVLTQAQIKKGSRLYEHGVSLSRAAAMLGITQWELQYYIGKTNVASPEDETVDIRKRIAVARSLFH